MSEPIFLSPVFKERIWGGVALKERFNYDIPTEQTGECWAISAHPHGQSTVLKGTYKGLTLKELWDNHRELFDNQSGEVFPLLTKVLDANKDLSVQVHPDDDYAKIHEDGGLGKTECWYIIDCKPNAEIIFGHYAQSKSELKSRIENGDWDKLLRRVPIQPGDFFYVPAGTIHALLGGTLVLETQQSSDTTYRVYDYDRTDDQGHKRELHLNQAIDVTTVPNRAGPLRNPKITNVQGAKLTHFVNTSHFSVYLWEINGKFKSVRHAPYLLCSVVDGNGMIHSENVTHSIRKGMHFVIPSTVNQYSLEGNMKLIVSHI